METGVPEAQPAKSGLSSEKREDIWALLIAGAVLVLALVIPEALYNLFKNLLYLF